MNKILMKDELGYFDLSKSEYIITNMFPRRPLINLLWNQNTVSRIDHFLNGDSFIWDGKFRRYFESGKRILYIKDLITNEVYSPSRNFLELPFDVFNCHVGKRYSKVVSSYKGLDVTFTVVVPINKTSTLYEAKLINKSNKEKSFNLYFYDELFTNVSGHNSAGKGVKDEKYGGLYFPHDGYGEEHKSDFIHLYAGCSESYKGYAVNKDHVLGNYGSYENPYHILHSGLASKDSLYEDNHIACFEVEVNLKPDEEKCIYFSINVGTDFDATAKDCIESLNKAFFDKTILEASTLEDDMFSRLQVNIPDEYLSHMINLWLKQQISFGKSWGRIYFKGVRDVLQDVTSFTSFAPELAKNRILITLRYQRSDGNPIRGYDPIALIKNNDGACWISDAVAQYIKETGDYNILDEVVPYFDEGEDTVFNHIYKGMIYLTTDVGKRGLTLFRHSDWNDSTNGAGDEGKGESVWTSEATIRALKIFSSLCEKISRLDVKEDIDNRINVMTENVLKYGLYNGHFIHGYDDNDNIVGGGKEDEEGSFCLNMQTWAVLANIGPKNFQEDLINQVERKLSCDYGYALSTPSYTKPKIGVGRTSYFMPGTFENGSVYLHAVMFKAVADCLLGRGDKAYETICKVLYRNNSTSGTEPYAMSNMYIGPSAPSRKGYAPHSWITGSAGWMYRALTEFILGVQADYDGLRITPCPPTSWNEYKVSRYFRKTTYNITFIKSDVSKIIVDGKMISGNLIPLSNNANCDVTVYYKVS